MESVSAHLRLDPAQARSAPSMDRKDKGLVLLSLTREPSSPATQPAPFLDLEAWTGPRKHPRKGDTAPTHSTSTATRPGWSPRCCHRQEPGPWATAHRATGGSTARHGSRDSGVGPGTRTECLCPLLPQPGGVALPPCRAPGSATATSHLLTSNQSPGPSPRCHPTGVPGRGPRRGGPHTPWSHGRGQGTAGPLWRLSPWGGVGAPRRSTALL